MLAPLAGLALGLAGSLHCVGMCGPIAISLPKSAPRPLRQSAHRMAYQFGRVTTYTALGAIVGLGGSAFSLAGYGRTLSITAGVLMIASAVLQLIWHRNLLPSALVERRVQPVQSWLRTLMARHGALANYGIGLVNGLLPCGLVTSALLGSIGTGSIASGAGFMLCFGLGTVPLMSAVAIGGATLSCSVRHKLRYATPAIALVIACIFVLRGMALGIPYLSPGAPSAKHPHACCVRAEMD